MPGPYVLISASSAELEPAAQRLIGLARAAGWAETLLDPGLWILMPLNVSHDSLRVGAWRLIGRVIARQDPVFEHESDNVWRFERNLLARFWGAYIAVKTGAHGAAALLRDVSGGLDCIVWETDGLTLAASAPPQWLKPPSDWRIAWPRVGAALHDPLAVWEDLLLDGPRAVGPGALQLLPLPTPQTRLWTPVEIARRAQENTPPAKKQSCASVRVSMSLSVAWPTVCRGLRSKFQEVLTRVSLRDPSGR